MFSIDGTWKSGRYDGGIIKINLNSGIMETQVSQLSMPHNILKENKKMYFCDSYNGKLIENKYNTKFQSNGFVRGFDSTDTIFVVCESKNRNFNRLKNGPINQCIDTRINIVDKKTGAYKSIQLPNYISEIHSLKIIKII